VWSPPQAAFAAMWISRNCVTNPTTSAPFGNGFATCKSTQSTPVAATAGGRGGSGVEVRVKTSSLASLHGPHPSWFDAQSWNKSVKVTKNGSEEK